MASLISINHSGLTGLKPYSATSRGNPNWEFYREWKDKSGAIWYDPYAKIPLAPGAVKNWASKSDNRIIERERAHAMLLAKHKESTP